MQYTDFEKPSGHIYRPFLKESEFFKSNATMKYPDTASTKLYKRSGPSCLSATYSQQSHGLIWRHFGTFDDQHISYTGKASTF
ncbi:hypothetical protein Hanom_Chr03g00262411 [Helianthus anomalus]